MGIKGVPTNFAKAAAGLDEAIARVRSESFEKALTFAYNDAAATIEKESGKLAAKIRVRGTTILALKDCDFGAVKALVDQDRE